MVGLFVAVLAFGLVSGGHATYAGSVVSSWYADPIYENGWYYYPCGLTYGGGYMWIPYATEGLLCQITKRRVSNGSLISSFFIDLYGYLPPKLGYRDNPRYLYGVTQTNPIQWFDAKTGSRLGTFYLPEIYWPTGIDYDDSHPGNPIWVCQWGTSQERPAMIWNLSGNGVIVSSFNLQSSPVNPFRIAYGHNAPGGPYLYVGTRSSPTLIYVMDPENGSFHGSFRAPISDNALSDLTWDGSYLWALENGGYPEPPNNGWVFRFVAHSFPVVAPASVGKIKALYR